MTKNALNVQRNGKMITKNTFKERLENFNSFLFKCISDAHSEKACNNIQNVAEIEVISINKQTMNSQRILKLTELVDIQKPIPPGSKPDEEQRQITHRLIKSLRYGRKHWWITKAGLDH